MERFETGGWISELVFVEGGGLLTRSGDYRVRRWPGGGQILCRAEAGCFSRDGRHLASTSFDRPFQVQRVSDGAVMAETARREFAVAAFSPDARRIALGLFSGGFGPGEAPQPGAVRSVALWSLGEPSLEWIGTHGFTTRENEMYGDCHYLNGIKALAFSPDGALLASSGEDGALRLWDLAAKSERAHREGGCPERLSFADAETLIGGWFSNPRSVVWRWREGRAEDRTGCVLAVSSGRAVVSTLERVSLVSLPRFEELRSVDLQKGEVAVSAALDGTAERAAFGTAKGALVVF